MFPFTLHVLQDWCADETLHRACTFGLATLSFLLAEAIPIFNYLLSLTGSICFAPLSLILPGCFWLKDFWSWKRGSAGRQAAFWGHVFVVLVGTFMCVAGTYATVQLIIDAYAAGTIGKPCLMKR
jgi:amino acid permease